MGARVTGGHGVAPLGRVMFPTALTDQEPINHRSSSSFRQFKTERNRYPPRPGRAGDRSATRRLVQIVRKRSRGLDRVATIAGTTAMRFATTSTPPTRRRRAISVRQRLVRRRDCSRMHARRPGRPRSPMEHRSLCQPPPRSWPARPRSRQLGRSRSPVPSTDPTSRRRRETLTTSRWSNVAAPNRANMAPKMSGKLTASPKLISEVGATASAVTDR